MINSAPKPITRVIGLCLALALGLILGLALLLGGCNQADGAGSQNTGTTSPQTNTASSYPDVPIGSGFDFYVLALSWSPSYCLVDGRAKSDRNQCGKNADFGFIVHGLWPQLESAHPAFCRSRQPDRVPGRLGEQLFDIVPSMGLIGHMWRKHGTCSGLDQSEYFGVVRAAWDRVRIPERFNQPNQPQNLSSAAVEEAFLSANPGLESDAIAAVCDGGRLREVRICLTDDLSFRACRAVDRSGCQARSLSVPPVR